MPGDCGIYSEEFWILLAKYERFEIGPATYPIPPYCLENRSLICIQMVTFLYPDGTLGGGSWVVDPCAPKGWRKWEPEPPPC